MLLATWAGKERDGKNMSKVERCRICNVELTDENWNPSQRKKPDRICKKCNNEKGRLWRKANPDRVKANNIRAGRMRGEQPYNKNKECAAFLGVHVAERVLSRVFKNVKRMPYGHPGYDIVCNKNKKIDIKSACINKHDAWVFNIRRNLIADYFLCLAFDNREDLNPLHAWLIPAKEVNCFTGIGICKNTIHKWDAYKLDVSRVAKCCDAMKKL